MKSQSLIERALSLSDAAAVVDDDETDKYEENEQQQGKCYYYSPIAEVAQQEGYGITNITSITQLEHWDCGIACLLMIGHWLQQGYVEKETCSNNNKTDDGNTNNNNNNNNNSNNNINIEDPPDNNGRPFNLQSNRSYILSNIRTNSIWTSDLMWQLHLWGGKGLMMNSNNTTWCTKKEDQLLASSSSSIEETSSFQFVLASKQLLSVDESYSNLHYYRNYFEDDQRRVNNTFRELYKHKVPMIQIKHGKTKTTTKRKDYNKMTEYNNDDDRKDDDSDVSLSTVVKIIQRDDCVAIILLDNHVLTQKSISSPSMVMQSQYHNNNKFHAVVPPSSSSTLCSLQYYVSDDKEEEYSATNITNSDHCDDCDNIKNSICSNHDDDDDEDEDDTSSNSNNNQQYRGHYVILCGISKKRRHCQIANEYERSIKNSNDYGNYYQQEEDQNSTTHNFCFVVRNPAPSFSSSYMFVTPYRLEASW